MNRRNVLSRSPGARPEPAPAVGPQRIGVFTSLDGALLDPVTFDAGVNRAPVKRLLASRVAVIPVTVMTLDEAAIIAAQLQLRDAMIIEAGGAIAWWSRRGWRVEQIGPSAETLLEAIRDIEDRSGASLAVYSALRESDAALLSGRSGAMLMASTRRQFSEPFLVERGSLDAVRRAATAIGFDVRRGRRFLYLCRAGDLAAGFHRVHEGLRLGGAIAIGSSMADLEFMRAADIATILPSSDREVDESLRRQLLAAQVFSEPGPAGWCAAVASSMDLLRHHAGNRWIST